MREEEAWAQRRREAWVRLSGRLPGLNSVRKKGGFSSGKTGRGRAESGNNWIEQGSSEPNTALNSIPSERADSWVIHYARAKEHPE